MGNIVMVAVRVLCILLSVTLSILIWKTAEYFNGLIESDKHKPLIAWDVLMLFIMLICAVVRVIVI